MDKIAILIPCYNESLTVGKVINDFKFVLPEANIYVYDNNSTDNTVEIATLHGAIVRHVKDQGKGNVIRAMFRDIEAECYLMIDGDDTYPAEHARDMIKPILSGEAEMVIGDRLSSTYFTENKRPFHNFGNLMVRKIINQLFKSNVLDIMTGYRAFSYAFVKTFSIQSKGFEIETEMTIHALDKHLSIVNVIVDYRDRPIGSESKLNTYRDGFRVLKTIGRLVKNYRPFRFFSIVSAFLLIIGLILFIPIFFDYLKNGIVEKVPTLIGTGFILLTAIIIFITGLFLDVQGYHHRHQFEIEFKRSRSYLNVESKK